MKAKRNCVVILRDKFLIFSQEKNLETLARKETYNFYTINGKPILY